MRKILISEHQLEKLSKNLLNEWSYIKNAYDETVDYLSGNQGKIPDALQKGEGTTAKYLRGESGYLPGDQTGIKNAVYREGGYIKDLQNKYKCLPKQFIYPFTLLLKKNYNKMWLKIALGIIGRESSYASGTRYNVTNIFKQMANYVGYNSSLGPAQMKGSTAEELGLKESDLSTDIGALDAAYRLIKKNFNLARQKGYTNKPSNLKGGTGNATLDIAIAAYNMGASKVMGPWCESVDPERIKEGLKTKCTKIPKSKQKIVVDYIPNFKTKRWDGVNISSHGYIREVANHVKKMNCI